MILEQFSTILIEINTTSLNSMFFHYIFKCIQNPFFEEVTVKEAAQICGCSRKTIQDRKKRILKTLKNK